VACPADDQLQMRHWGSTTGSVFASSTIFRLFDDVQHTVPKTVGCLRKSVTFHIRLYRLLVLIKSVTVYKMLFLLSLIALRSST
jgi:hypothetical protein